MERPGQLLDLRSARATFPYHNQYPHVLMGESFNGEGVRISLEASSGRLIGAITNTVKYGRTFRNPYS